MLTAQLYRNKALYIVTTDVQDFCICESLHFKETGYMLLKLMAVKC